MRGLTILHDGWSSWSHGSSAEHIQIPGYNAQRGWQFAFGASSSPRGVGPATSDYHWIDNLVIWSTWLIFGPAPYPLQVSLNGQQYFSAHTNITYTADAAISVLVPQNGPALGNTQLRVEGANFRNGDHYTCRFGSTVVGAEPLPGGALQCYTPSLSIVRTDALDGINTDSRPSGDVLIPVAISLNNQVRPTPPHSHLVWTFSNPLRPLLTHSRPSLTPSSTLAPPLPPSPQDYTVDPITFSYREPTVVSAINPNAGPADGGSLVVIRGSSFAGGHGFHCAFGTLPPIPATLRGSRTLGYYLECHSPRLNASQFDLTDEVVMPLEVTVNNQQYAPLPTTHDPPPTTHHSRLGRPSQVHEQRGALPILRPAAPFHRPSHGWPHTRRHHRTRQLLPGRFEQRLDGLLPLRHTGVCAHLSPSACGRLLTARCYCAAHPHVFPSSLSPPQLSVGAVISNSEVDCPSPETALPTEVMLSISANAQQFSNAVQFVYYAPPIVSSISPSTGPGSGETLIDVRGVDLAQGSAYRCQFGSFPFVRVEASYEAGPPSRVLCTSLAAPGPENVRFEISLNAQQYTTDANHFNFYQPPRVHDLSPSTGPVHGDTFVRVTGVGFEGGSHYLCMFAMLDSPSTQLRVPATFVSTHLTTCVAPLITADSAVAYRLRVSLNGQQFSPHADTPAAYGFHGYSEVHAASPNSGPVVGGTLVTIDGVHLGNGSDYRCRFGGSTVNASYSVPRDVVSCFSPRMPVAASILLEVSQNGQQFTASGRSYSFYGPSSMLALDSSIAYLHPLAGPTGGTTLVGVHGHALAGGSDYRCKFGHIDGIPATVVSSELITCHSPALPIGAVNVSIALNAQQYMSMPLPNFTFYEPNRVLELSPSTGSTVGGSIVTLTGLDFVTFSAHPIMCRFGEQRAATTRIDDTTLECLSPASTTTGQHVAIAYDAPFDDHANPGGIMYGHAQLAYGRLELTPGYEFQTGSYTLSLEDRLAPLPWFELAMAVSITPGARNLRTPTGGMGFSISFGNLPDAPFGELGAGNGLRLCFLTANTTLTAHYAGRYLGRANTSGLLGLEYAELTLGYAHGYLNVTIDGYTILRLPNLSAEVESETACQWRWGFGARTGLYHDAHILDNVTFRSGSCVSSSLSLRPLLQPPLTFSNFLPPFPTLPHLLPPSPSSLSLSPPTSSNLLPPFPTSSNRPPPPPTFPSFPHLHQPSPTL